MSQLLFQGVEGDTDERTNSVAVLRSRILSPVVSRSPVPESDKLREECGVVAIHGHPDAARQAYLGLYALQHRGQESAGIATADGQHLANIKGMGLVSEIFTDDVLAKLPGPMAIGHTRYSTTGDSALLNAQPIRVDSTKGLIAIAHNGNLVNLGNLRARAGARRRLLPDHVAIPKSSSSSSRTPALQRWWTRSPIRWPRWTARFPS